MITTTESLRKVHQELSGAIVEMVCADPGISATLNELTEAALGRKCLDSDTHDDQEWYRELALITITALSGAISKMYVISESR